MPHKEYDTLVHMTTGQQVAASSLSDEELIAGARVGYDAYIGALWKRYGPSVQQGIRYIAGEQTDEVVSDAFMSLPRRLASYTHQGKFDKWIFGVAFNLARRRARSERRRREVDWSDAVAEPRREASAPARVSEHEVMDHAMQSLSDSEREAFLLSYRGFEPREIAELLELSPSAAAVRVHRARAKVAHLFTEKAKPKPKDDE